MRLLSSPLLIAVCAVSFSHLGLAQTSDSVYTLTGQSYAFAVTVPVGWKLEPGHGTWSGTRAIVFPAAAPKSSTMWGNPDAWITVGISSKQSEGTSTLRNLLAFYAKVDSQQAKSASDLPGLVTQDGKTAILQRKVGHGSFGAIAFVEDQTTIAVFELNRFDNQQFEGAYPKFEQLIRSYRTIPSTNESAK